MRKAIAGQNTDYEKEVLLKQADLQALQSQINPHFLYNTLECIRGMALMEGKENIADIALSLSRFFRYSISGKSDVVSLRDEVENCRTYTRIQNYRFQNRFVLKVEEDQSVTNAMVPKLILQPIVENAILHGLQNILQGGVIEIRVEPVGDNIRIIISDNGSGMTPEKLEDLSRNILNGGQQAADHHHAGIAMYNVDRRLKLMFGPEYGLSVFSCEGMGTDVELRIPYRPGGRL